MRRKTILALISVLVVAVAAFLLPALGPRAQAQQACTEFRAIGHATLPTTHPLSPDDTWGADVWGTLGGEFLTGYVTGNDGDPHGNGMSGQATNGHYTYTFGPGDSVVVEIGHAAWPFPPGKAGLGYYRGTGKIVQGTGRFQYASGNVDWAGPFIVWSPDGENFYGRFNAEIRGNICGVQ